MKKIIKYIWIIILLFCSCAKSGNISKDTSVNQEAVNGKYQLSINHKYGGKQKDTILAENAGYYTKFLARTDYVIGITKTSIPHMKSNTTGFFIGRKNGCGYNIVKNPQELPHDIYINGESLKAISTKGHDGISVNDLFGSKVNFQIGNHRKLGKRFDMDPDDPGEELLPSEIHITSPDLDESEDGYPLCYYSDFIVNWTEDMNNDNGIIIAVEWNGTMVFGEHYQNTSIRVTDLFEDTGEATLNPHMFDDIPDTALCFLTVMRGIVIFDDEDETSYSFMAECSETIPFVLIRNIDII